MSSIVTTLLTVSLLVSTAEPPAVALQRRRAEFLAETGNNVEAADAWLVLAKMEGVDRLHALDEARSHLTAAYFFHDDIRWLCRAVAIADDVIDAKAFPSEAQAGYWQGFQDEDLKRLQAHAVASGRANCRFTANGEPRPKIALLEPDTPPKISEATPRKATPITTSEAAPPGPVRKLEPANNDQSNPWPENRPRQPYYATSVILSGVAAGFALASAGMWSVTHRHHKALRWQLNDAADRDFTTTEMQQFLASERRAYKSRNVALGLACGAVFAVTTAAIVWVIGKKKPSAKRVHFTGASLRF